MAPSAKRATHAQILGARIKTRRTELGWTQAELAHAARKHVTYISRLEGGGINPSLSAVVDVAFALGVNVATLTVDLLPPSRRGRPRGTRPPAGDVPTTDA